MSKQTRRAVSVKGETYTKLKQYCDEHKRSMSGMLEQLIAEFFQDNRAEPEEREPPPKPFRMQGWQSEKPEPPKDGPIRGGGTHLL